MKRYRLTLILFCSVLASLLFSPLFSYAEGPFEQGMKEFKEENYEEAIQHFLEARKLEPTSSTVAFYLGLTYKLTENYKAAVPHLKDAVTFTPRVKEAVVELIDALYQTDDLKEANKWIEVGEKENIQPARIQFLKGLVLAKEGRYMEAVTAFEKAKSIDPSMAQAAEFQIAAALTKEGKLKEAQKRFKSTITLDPTTDMATYAKDYEKMVAEKIERERPWRFSVGLNYKYDSNVVAKGTGPIADYISGSEDSAINLSMRIGYTFPFSFKTPYNLSFQYSLFAEKYFPKKYERADGTTGDLSEYNNMTNAFSLIPGYNFEKWSLSFPITYIYNSLQGDKGNSFLGEPTTWWNTTRYMEQYGITPTARFMVTKNSIGELSVGIGQKRYFETLLHPEPITSDEDRDATMMNSSLGWTYFFKEGKGIFSLKYTYGKEEADGHNWSIDYENRFATTFLYPLYDIIKRPIKFLASADIAFTKYKFENTFFNTKRRNDTYYLSGGFIYEGFMNNLFKGKQEGFLSELFKNTDLIAQYTYIRDRCNIKIYDYKRELISLGLEYKF